MLNRCIERADWGHYFDRLTAGRADVLDQAKAVLHVYRPDGDAARDDLAHDRARLPFLGVAWEPAQEAITVALEGLNHQIRDPLVVWADEPPGEPLRRLVILGARGRRDEIAFKRAGLRGRFAA